MGMTGSKKHLKPLKTRELGKAKIERRLTASWRLRFSWNFAGRRPWVTGSKKLPLMPGAPLLIAHALMQNLPKQSAQSMGDGPDGLLIFQARQQPSKRHLKYASFDLYRRMSSLIEQTPHGAVPFR